MKINTKNLLVRKAIQNVILEHKFADIFYELKDAEIETIVSVMKKAYTFEFSYLEAILTKILNTISFMKRHSPNSTYDEYFQLVKDKEKLSLHYFDTIYNFIQKYNPIQELSEGRFDESFYVEINSFLYNFSYPDFEFLLKKRADGRYWNGNELIFLFSLLNKQILKEIGKKREVLEFMKKYANEKYFTEKDLSKISLSIVKTKSIDILKKYL